MSEGGKEGRKRKRGKEGREKGESWARTQVRQTNWQSYISMSDSILPVPSVDVIGRILQLTHPICAQGNKQPSHLSKVPSGGQVNHTLLVVCPVPTVGVPCVVRELPFSTPLIVHPVSLSNQSDCSTVVICNSNQSTWPRGHVTSTNRITEITSTYNIDCLIWPSHYSFAVSL